MSTAADRTRLQLTFIAILWGSTFLLLFLAFRTRAKPLFMLGIGDLVLAIVVTMLAINHWKRSRER